MRSPRFTRTPDGRLTTTIDGVTYTATWYRSGGPGTRAYWTIRHDGPFAPDYDHDGNDWYEPNETRVRESIVAYAAKATTNGERRCTSCGEPETGGDFGWFDHDTDGLVCNSCGSDPLTGKSKGARS